MQVLAEFDKHAAIQYSKHMYEWKQKWRLGKPPPKDLDEDIWKGFCEYWSNPNTQKLSETNTKNRRSDRGGKGMYIHNGGAKIVEREVMEIARRDGVPPDYLRVIELRHTNKTTGAIQDAGMSELVETCKKKKLDQEQEVGISQLTLDGSSSSNQLSREEINEIVLQETRKVKGRFAGLGGLPTQESSSSVPRFGSGYREEIEKLTQTVKERDAEVEALRLQNTSTQTQLDLLRQQLARAFPDLDLAPADAPPSL